MSEQQTPVTADSAMQRAAVRIVSGIENAAPSLAAGMVAVGGIGTSFSPAAPVPFFGGALLVTVGAVLTAAQQPRIRRLIQEASEAREGHDRLLVGMSRLLYLTLQRLAEDLRIDFDSARISVYRHDDDAFVPLSRYSTSQTLGAYGRLRYPVGAGVIGLAWDTGLYATNNLPRDRQEWVRVNAEGFAMSREVLEAMRMQPLSLGAVRIEGPFPGSTPVGLLVIESTQPRGITMSTMGALQASPHYERLSHILTEVLHCVSPHEAERFRTGRLGVTQR